MVRLTASDLQDDLRIQRFSDSSRLSREELINKFGTTK
jgi:hypothetical protein